MTLINIDIDFLFIREESGEFRIWLDYRLGRHRVVGAVNTDLAASHRKLANKIISQNIQINI